MNFHVFVLFWNALFVTILSSGIVLWILRKQYLPAIKKLEEEQQQRDADKKMDN